MARRTLTGSSSTNDIAFAQSELRSAQNALDSWEASIPDTILPGGFRERGWTLFEREQQARQIAAQFDYVEFGVDPQLTTGEVTLSSGSFFVPNLSSAIDVSPPQTISSALESFEDRTTIVSGGAQTFDVAGTPQTFGDALDSSFGSETVSTGTGTGFGQTDNFVRPEPPSVGSLSDAQRPNRAPGTTQEQPSVGSTQSLEITDTNQEPVTLGGYGSANSDDIDGRGSGIVGGDPLVDSLENQIPQTSQSVDIDRDGVGGTQGVQPGLERGAVGDASGNVTQRSNTTTSLTDEIDPGTGIEGQTGATERQNILHGYANWTYNLSLYMLTPAQYNAANGGSFGDDRGELLMRSGGVGQTATQFSPERDYYIDDLEFSGVVGQNYTNSGGLNYNITFKVTEPYGVNFLADLARLSDSLGIRDQFETAYLLEIQFNGYRPDGTPAPNILPQPKFLPIKIINVTFEIKNSATEYMVEAVPYNHTALQDHSSAIIYENITIKGRTFEDAIQELQDGMNSIAEIQAGENELNQQVPDIVDFEILDPDLRASLMNTFEHVTDGEVPEITRTEFTEDGSQTQDTLGTINAGQTLRSAIQYLVQASDFGAVYNTTNLPGSQGEGQPIRLVTVIPQVEIGEVFNEATQRYQRITTYKIGTQRRWGDSKPNAANGEASQRGYVKRYSWIFTGENEDIEDFEATYNIQYFNLHNMYQRDRGNVRGTQGAGDGASLPAKPLDPNYTPSRRPSSTNASHSPGSNSFRSSAHQTSMDLMDNLLNNPGADMLSVDLTIIGDPDWIVQDASILGGASATDKFTIGRSISTDTGDIFVVLEFKTPRDYNRNTGLMNIEDTNQSLIQGWYRVLTVTNTFSGGRFNQILNLVRVENQNSNTVQSITPKQTAVNREELREFNENNPGGTIS